MLMIVRYPPNLSLNLIRFGTAELYEVIEHHFSPISNPSHVITDCVVVGQSIQGGTDERVILFITLPAGDACTPELERLIKSEIRKRRSARHVPSKVIIHLGACPMTFSSFCRLFRSRRSLKH